MTELKLLEMWLDPEQEWELLIDWSFGADVQLIYADGEEDWIYNCTEIHWGYRKSERRRNRVEGTDPGVAFESDIHNQGCSQDTQDLAKVYISKAPTKHIHF
jgi:hypothetical protein